MLLLSLFQDDRNNLFRHWFELCRYAKQRALSGNSERSGVTCNVGALKNSILKPPDQLAERELRRGIERWENEGGRLFPRVKRDSESHKGFSRSGFLHDKEPGA